MAKQDALPAFWPQLTAQFDHADPTRVRFTGQCQELDKTYTTDYFPLEQLMIHAKLLKNGKLPAMEDVFPRLTPGDREFLKSGLSPEGYDALFGGGPIEPLADPAHANRDLAERWVRFVIGTDGDPFERGFRDRSVPFVASDYYLVCWPDEHFAVAVHQSLASSQEGAEEAALVALAREGKGMGHFPWCVLAPRDEYAPA
jgi:hypothetical protein